jgi:hypothetical protein
MAHEDHHGHGYDPNDRPYFPAAEWEQFQKDDIRAGGAVIVLMASIFTIGLFLYTVIAIITSQSA